MSGTRNRFDVDPLLGEQVGRGGVGADGVRRVRIALFAVDNGPFDRQGQKVIQHPIGHVV